jgi:hypothetical protein
MAAVSPRPDDLSPKLHKHVTNYNLGVFSLVGALIRVSNDFQIPIGIAYIDSPAVRAELPFAWKEATVLEIIETIAKTQPGYHVQVRNGVVHIFPMIPDAQNFLKLKIEEFNVHNDYIELASFELHSLITPRRYSLISIGATGDSKVDVELKNSAAEDALDALAIASNRKIWIVTFSNDTRLTQRGFRRTKSLWTEEPIPDAEQPVWQLMRWGDPMPPAVVAAKRQN